MISVLNESVNHDISIHHVKGYDDEFLSIESLGVQYTPRCGGCICGGCQLGGKDFSIRERREHNLINDGLQYKNGYWLADYPWIKDLAELPDYRIAALRAQKDALQQIVNMQKFIKNK